MTTKDLSKYAKDNWQDFEEEISEISKDGKGKSLVESDKKQYNFDKICLGIFGEQKPTSADGIEATEKLIKLTEFKSGFKRNITKENYKAIAHCDKTESKEICEDYWKLFFKEQKKEIHELIESIRLKAIESYITLEKRILPQCQDAEGRIRIRLIVVIDGDEADAMEDAYSELAKVEPSDEENHFSSVRKALKRLHCQSDANGNDYYYDDITVMPVQDYISRLKLT